MKTRAGVSVAVAVLLSAFSGVARAESHAARIGFAGYRGTETLTDFPALIKLPDVVAGFAYADAEADGSDLYFTDSSGNTIPHEIDRWDASGSSTIWVKVPSLDANTTITMHWGDLAAAEDERLPSAATWSDYVGVWHMNAVNGTDQIAEPDAAGHGLAAAPGGRSPGEIAVVPDGVIGSACQIQAVGGSGNGLVVPPYWEVIDNPAIMTISGWFCAKTKANWMRFFTAQKGNGEGVGWEAYIVQGDTALVSANGSSGYPGSGVNIPDCLNTWVHLQFVFQRESIAVYANGHLCGTFTTRAITPRGDGLGFSIGNNANLTESSWRGYCDEVRMYNGALSADRIQAEYDTANDPVAFIKGGNAGPAHTASLYCSGYTGSETLTNFPVQVVLPDCVTGFSYGDVLADGSDIWFVDEDGNVLASELDAWKSKGRSSFWVKIPELTRERRITVCWGGTPPAERPDPASVWSAYAGVWHMGKADGATGTAEPDATGHGLDAVPATHPATNLIAEIKSRWSGDWHLLGQCCQNQTSGAVYQGKGCNGLKVPPYDAYMTDATKLSVGGWFWADNSNGYMRFFSAQKSNQEGVGWEVWANNSVSSVGVTGSRGNQTVSTPSFHNAWLYIVAVYDGPQVTLYLDGRPILNRSVTPIVPRTDGLGFTIGNDADLNENGWRGCYDEVRLTGGALSADWIFAEYLTQSAPARFLREVPAEALTFADQSPHYGCSFIGTSYVDVNGFRFLGGITGSVYGYGESSLYYAGRGMCVTVPSLHGCAVTVQDGDGTWGTGFAFGSGDWTLHARVRMADLANGVVWSLGASTGGNFGLALVSDGTAGAALVLVKGLQPLEGSRLAASVPDATIVYHDYTAVFRAAGKAVDLFVDGELKGTLPYLDFNPANDAWQWFNIYGGTQSPFERGEGIRIDDFRFYHYALRTEEMAALKRWGAFDPAVFRTFTATVSEDTALDDLAWTPAKPVNGFAKDDVLAITFTAPGKTVEVSGWPVVAGITVSGCPDAAFGEAGTLRLVGDSLSGTGWVRLRNGAAFDQNGRAQDRVQSPRMVLEESGILCSSIANGVNRAQFSRGIELSPGATAYLVTDSTMGLVNVDWDVLWADLNDGRLVKCGGGTCWLANTVLSGGGTLEVREGQLTVAKKGFQGGTVAVEVKAGATFGVEITSSLGMLAGAGTVTVSEGNTLTVDDCISGQLTVTGRESPDAVLLSDGVTLDLSGNTGPFVQPAALTWQGRVNLLLPEGVQGRRMRLIAWDNPPDDSVVEFAAEQNGKPVHLQVKQDGLWTFNPATVITIQ